MSRILLLACLVLALPLQAADDDQPYPQPSDDNPQTDDSRPMLGVNMSPVPVPVQRENNIAHDEGVYVRHVYDGTTATDIGITRGDVIVTINGQDIDSMSTVRDSIFSRRVGDEIAVTVLRDGERVELGGRLGGWPQHIPLNNINAAAEERYRQMQARRLAHESEVLDQKLAAAQAEAAHKRQNTLARRNVRERSSNELDRLLADDFDGQIEASLPRMRLPALAGLFDFRFDFQLACADPTATEPADPTPRSIPRWTHLSEAELADLAPEVDLTYAFCVSTESL